LARGGAPAGENATAELSRPVKKDGNGGPVREKTEEPRWREP
jgi:hypothetical protein